MDEGFIKEALADGAAAYRAGQSHDDNPHPVGSGEHRFWIYGFQSERRSAVRYAEAAE